MTRIASTPCKVVAIVMIVFSLSANAQPELVALNNEPSSSTEQSKTSVEKSTLIVDSDSNSKVYPTMEQEMDMYIKLRSKDPQAYFFPNPSNGIVWIEHNLGEECTVQILDEKGHILFTARHLQAKKLDLTDFRAGSYSIEASNGKSTVMRSLEVR